MQQFNRLLVTDQKLIRNYLKKCSQITSDYTFLNLWGWQDIYKLDFLFHEELIWIRENRENKKFWAPIGNWEDLDWMKYYEFLKGNTFIRVPERLVDLWKRYFIDKMMVIEDRDNWDYIYLVDELIQLKGNRFHKKKNLLKQFKKKYGYRFVTLEDRWIEEAENFQVDWCYYKDCENKKILIEENRVILNVLENWSRFEKIVGGGLVVDDRLVAYTVAEPADEDTLVIHFEKGCPTYKGIYQAINNIFLKECARNYIYVNREQDLGDKGLRQAKLSYNPCCFLKKYVVKF